MSNKVPQYNRASAEDWDAQYKSHGHTGYANDQLYRYDQPLRMRFVRSAIRRVTIELSTPRFALDIGSGSGDVMDELRAVNLIDIGAILVSVSGDRSSYSGHQWGNH